MTNEISPRELEVMKLFAKGLSKKEISERLFIAVKTVKTHIERISEKLDIHGGVNLLRYALINGILTIEDLKEQP